MWPRIGLSPYLSYIPFWDRNYEEPCIYAPIQNHKSLANYFLAGDEIFSVNGRSVAGLTHSEAIGIFKETKVGPIQVTIGRRETNKKVLQMDDDRA